MEKFEQVIITIKLISATVCSGIIGFLGGWDTALKVLLLFTAIDIGTGFLKGIYMKELESNKAYKGFIKKIGIYLIVGIACLLDELFNMEFIRSGAVGFYIATEGISIFENWGKMDLPMPTFLKSILLQLKTQSDEGKVDKK